MHYLGDLISPAADTRPPRTALEPDAPYVVCSTPRSGSGMLCRGIASTGVAGVPMEYFDPQQRRTLSSRWGCGSDLGSYARALWSHRTTADGVFGAKLHWGQLVALRAEALGVAGWEPGYDVAVDFLEQLTGPARYVRIVRRDVDAQAVSYWTALHSGVWSDAAGGSDAEFEAPYSFEGIDRCRRLIENAEVHWDRFFRANAIEPLDVVYEDLVADHERTVVDVLWRVAPGRVPPRVPPPRTRALGGAHAAALRERFVADRAGRPLPDPLEAS